MKRFKFLTTSIATLECDTGVFFDSDDDFSGVNYSSIANVEVLLTPQD
jgi:hypothetical protein